jgi:hypothetical protein
MTDRTADQPPDRPPDRPGPYRTGDADLDRRLQEVLGSTGVKANRDQLFEILVSSVLLAGDGADRLDLKITNAALREMRAAFRMFAPYRDVPKVTIFGSARTLPDDPLYGQARQLAAELAARGWMVVTGAGPGIMAAGTEGAGRERSIGILIRLPFEGGANPFIAGDDKLVEMKYFFTRKLMLLKESRGVVCLPGGFGTLDETFELLTLVQTGKAEPLPIVLLDTPGGTYWEHWRRFLHTEVAGAGLISEVDLTLVRVTDSVDEAIQEVTGFYRNYHSLRYVGDRLVLRLREAPSAEELEQLTTEFADIVVAGAIAPTAPLPPEVATDDFLDLPRVAFRFDNHGFARLRLLIDALNRLPSAPAETRRPPVVKDVEER